MPSIWCMIAERGRQVLAREKLVETQAGKSGSACSIYTTRRERILPRKACFAIMSLIQMSQKQNLTRQGPFAEGI